MQAFNRRAFLKGTGTFALAAAASGLLCGAAAPAEAVPMTETVGGLVVHTVRAFAKDYGHTFRHLRYLEIHFDLENRNDFPVYFHQENFLVHLGNVRRDTYAYFSGLNKWNGSRYIQDVHLEPGERQTISYSCKLQAEDLEAGLRAENPAPWCIALLYGQQRQSFTGYLLPDQYSSDLPPGQWRAPRFLQWAACSFLNCGVMIPIPKTVSIIFTFILRCKIKAMSRSHCLSTDCPEETCWTISV